MPAVSLRSAVVLIERFPALAGADLEVAAGEILLLRGANGAGKSTLLHVCAGLQRLTSGAAVVLGCDLGPSSTGRRGRADLRRRVGLLGHHTALYDDLTVAENLELWAKASRVGAGAVAGALDRLGIGARLAGVAAARLSAGQRRRVALAAVVLRRPELWLLDEPHSSLDGGGRDLVDGIVSEAAASGATIVMASHDASHAPGLATRTVTMAGGTALADVG